MRCAFSPWLAGLLLLPALSPAQNVATNSPATQPASSHADRMWFPPWAPVMQPYLANINVFGTNASQPGPLLAKDPLLGPVQWTKSTLGEIGLRYSLYQSLTAVSMTGTASGSGALQYYTATFFGNWLITGTTNNNNTSSLTMEVNSQLGLSAASRHQSPQGNLGSIVNPLDTVYGPDGAWISELAWQQCLMNGELVVVAGQVDQSNYLDLNSYANNSQGQLMNGAFANSQVLPMGYNNLGLNVQFQPDANWYAIFGTGANNQGPGQSPFAELGCRNWSYLLELGLTPDDVLGLGPGVYRLQPFVATVNGNTQTGAGLNVQQQLGTNSPFAWFGRFGVSGTAVAGDGAAAQIASGFVMQAPLQHLGLCPSLSNDYLGAGFVWSQPAATLKPAVHQNEYGLETTYVLQLTPLASLQPDVQLVWNAANNPNASCSAIFQLQLNVVW